MTNNNSFDRVRTTGLQYTNAWVDSTFEPYALPSNLGQDVIDPVDDHIQYRCQCHYLGPAYIKYGDLPSIHVDFYKVIRSEISQLVYDKKKSGQRYSHGGADGGAALSSPEGTEVCHYLSETVHVAAVSQVERSNNIGASFGLFSTSTSPSPTASPTSTTATATAAMTTTTTIPLMLPLKKRKKRRVTQQYVIFSLHRDGATHSALPSSLPPDCTYYLFPQHSLTTVINDMAPLQMLCTFHLSQQQPSTHTGLSDDHGATTAYSPPSGIQYRTKLEELAAICSSTEHLSSGTNDSTSTPSWSSVKYDSIHVNILEASLDLYYSLKEAGTGCHGSFDGKADLAHTHNRLLEMYKIDSTLLSDQGQEPRAKISRRHTTTGEEIITTTDDSPLLFNTKRKYMSIGGNQTPLVKSEVDTGDKDYPHATKKKKTKRMSASNGKHDSNATARTRQCTYCSATSTPMWRRGPEGAGTLCNACGVKWKHGKILNGDDTPTDQKPHTGKPSCKRKRSATSAYTKEKRAKPIEPGALLHQSTDSTVAPPPMDSRLHEHVCYAQDTLDSIRHDSNLITSTSITTHERSVGILTASASPSSSNESFGHSPFTSFTSSPTSIDSQHHPLAFLTDKFGVNDDDLTLTSAAADVEAAAVLTLLSQS